ncbi:MAG: valine--pyruvate transaminase [Planctomycetota bacterium]
MKHGLSTFGKRLAHDSGIGELMRDLGEALAAGNPETCMLGGGQPSHLPELTKRWRERLHEIGEQAELADRVLGNYQPPAGDLGFRKAVAELFRREYDWPITAENVCVTAGGQAAFFLLFNAIAGRFDDGSCKRVLFPIVPEYIGYADQSTSTTMFKANRPKIEKIGTHEFKYAIDFESLEIDENIAAICLSRPTNPSSNVVTDDELLHLSELAEQHDIPLIVDNAYGNPFPGAVFGETNPIWNENIISTHSLSKLGLPGTRTGIVIADAPIVRYIAEMNAITALANNNLGQAIVQPMIESGEILQLSRETIRPFYQRRANAARGWLTEALGSDIPYRLHRSEGAFFLWLWLEGLPITSQQLYERLKARGVLVISGHYFFFGVNDDWSHQHECLRISFTAPEEFLHRGFQVLAEELQAIYRDERVTC